VDAAEVLRQGGFAFAALLMGSILVWVLRWIFDRLLTRFATIEKQQAEVLKGFQEHNEISRGIADTLRQVEIAIARWNGRKTGT